jgi:hypothetical protein
VEKIAVSSDRVRRAMISEVGLSDGHQSFEKEQPASPVPARFKWAAGQQHQRMSPRKQNSCKRRALSISGWQSALG